MTDDILVSAQDGIATVTFNRPKQRNAITYHGWHELRRIALDLERDPDTKVVVFTGAGDAAFSAGADIKDFESYRDNSAKARVYAEAFDGAMDTIEAMSKPTICMIRGFCVGGGCELSMATDIRIAADNSRFGIPRRPAVHTRRIQGDATPRPACRTRKRRLHTAVCSPD